MDATAVEVPEVIDGAAARRLLGALDHALTGSRPVVVLAGEPGRFCRGLDPTSASPADLPPLAEALERLLSSPKPTLALVDGPALGGGLGLAAAADVVLATPRATFGLPEGLFGLAPAIIRSALERRLTPQRLALLALTPHARSAAESMAVGLVDEIVDEAGVDRARRRWMHSLGRASAQTVRALRQWPPGGLGAAMEAGVRETAATLDSPEVKSRLRAWQDGEVPWEAPRLTASPEPVCVDVDASGVAVVTMREEASHNALSREMVAALGRAFAAVGRRADVRVVVLAGLSDWFSSGASLSLLRELISGDLASGEILLPRLLLECPLPCIAAMSGHAVGGGFVLGLCADVVLLGRESRYALNFMNMGFTPAMGATRLLEHALSPALAHELLFSGEARRGRDFEGRAGVNHVLPAEEVLPRALDLAARMAEKPRPALAALKRVVSVPRRQAFEAARTMETLMHEISFGQRDVARWIEDEFGDDTGGREAP